MPEEANAGAYEKTKLVLIDAGAVGLIPTTSWQFPIPPQELALRVNGAGRVKELVQALAPKYCKLMFCVGMVSPTYTVPKLITVGVATSVTLGEAVALNPTLMV